jgi:hypothetical protein
MGAMGVLYELHSKEIFGGQFSTAFDDFGPYTLFSEEGTVDENLPKMTNCYYMFKAEISRTK